MRILRTTAQLRETRATGASLGTEEQTDSPFCVVLKNIPPVFLSTSSHACNTLVSSKTKTRSGIKSCSHETLQHFGLQSSHLNTCAEQCCLVGSTNSCPTKATWLRIDNDPSPVLEQNCRKRPSKRSSALFLSLPTCTQRKSGKPNFRLWPSRLRKEVYILFSTFCSSSIIAFVADKQLCRIGWCLVFWRSGASGVGANAVDKKSTFFGVFSKQVRVPVSRCEGP